MCATMAQSLPCRRKRESWRWVFAGYSRTFPVGIRGYLWVFAGIRGHVAARLFEGALVWYENSYESLQEVVLWTAGNVIRADFNYNTINVGRAVGNNGRAEGNE